MIRQAYGGNGMEYRIDNNLITVLPEERISSDNALQFEREVTELCDTGSYDGIVIDAEKLVYISSAGLRVIMKLMKRYKNISVINTSPEVYDVFSVTGFAELIKVEKAYKKISVDGCDIIGIGAYGTVYRVSDETIVKVLRSNDALPMIKRERELAKRAFVLGIPTAISYDIVKVGDLYGAVFELINAKSAAQTVADEPGRLGEIIEKSVEIMKQLASTEVKKDELPQQRDIFIGHVKKIAGELPEAVSEKLISLLSAMPDTYTMVHGDCHFKNLMVQGSELIIIDMDTLSAGDPIFELAGIYSPYQAFPEISGNEDTMRFMGLPYDTVCEIWNTTLKLYLGDEYEELRESTLMKAKLLAAILVVTALDLMNRENDELRVLNLRHICEITPLLDTLTLK